MITWSAKFVLQHPEVVSWKFPFLISKLLLKCWTCTFIKFIVVSTQQEGPLVWTLAGVCMFSLYLHESTDIYIRLIKVLIFPLQWLLPSPSWCHHTDTGIRLLYPLLRFRKPLQDSHKNNSTWHSKHKKALGHFIYPGIRNISRA